MPRVVGGCQPPRAAAGQRGTRAHYIVMQSTREKIERQPSFLCILYYSARGGSCDQGWQNAYFSGLLSVAFFLTLYM